VIAQHRSGRTFRLDVAAGVPQSSRRCSVPVRSSGRGVGDVVGDAKPFWVRTVADERVERPS